jgi:uncharacterized protein YeeX (DUF496 family)
MIDKKIRETYTSMRINFYDRMDQETIPEKKEISNQANTFFDKMKAMFCVEPPSFDFL